jgi:hypothetical protein
MHPDFNVAVHAFDDAGGSHFPPFIVAYSQVGVRSYLERIDLQVDAHEPPVG